MEPNPEHEPSEHLIRLPQVILALIVINSVFPCVAALFGLPEYLLGITHLPAGLGWGIFFTAPCVLVVAASLLGVVLARSVPSRRLFVATTLFGLALPILLLMLVESLR
jgi:hypothetical protein